MQILLDKNGHSKCLFDDWFHSGSFNKPVWSPNTYDHSKMLMNFTFSKNVIFYMRFLAYYYFFLSFIFLSFLSFLLLFLIIMLWQTWPKIIIWLSSICSCTPLPCPLKCVWIYVWYICNLIFWYHDSQKMHAETDHLWCKHHQPLLL